MCISLPKTVAIQRRGVALPVSNLVDSRTMRLYSTDCIQRAVLRETYFHGAWLVFLWPIPLRIDRTRSIYNNHLYFITAEKVYSRRCFEWLRSPIVYHTTLRLGRMGIQTKVDSES